MVIRMSGMASGMDIESIVKNLMTAERMPLDKLKQKKQTLEWQRDDYRTMNTLLLDFRTELTQMKLTNKYRVRTVTSSDESRVTATATSAASQASYSIEKVTRLAIAENWVTNNTIEKSGHTLDASASLASQARDDSFAGGLTWAVGAVGSKTLTGNAGTTGLSIEIHDDEKIQLDDLTKMSVKVNGVSYDVLADGISIDPDENQVKIDERGNLTFSNTIASGATVKVDYITDKKVQESKLSAASSTVQLNKKEIINDANFKLTVGNTTTGITAVNGDIATLGTLGSLDLTTGKITFNTEKAQGTEIKATYQQNYADFSITSQTSNGKVQEKFLVQSSETINQVISRVNNSKAGVSMFLDSATNKVSLMRTETGDFHEDSSNGAYDPVTNPGGVRDSDITIGGDFATNTLGLVDSNVTKTHGENADFVINGLSTTRSTNTFDLSGVSITLKKEFDDGESTFLSINNDGNAVYDNIKSFVDKYNTLIGAISAKTSEERFRTYTPLTDDQREQLSDKQQEQWEEKAKSGLLRRDSILTGVLSSMRSNFSQPVSNSEVDPMFKQLASIGITTTANYLEGGKLEINEAKLKEAINNNPDAVEALFRGGSDESPIGDKGIARRLYDSVNETMDKLKERAGNTFSTNQQFTLGRQLSTIDSSITRFEDRLTQVEDRYWRQFTAMEKAIQQANSQSSYLMQQFSM